jgi:ATP-dependent DNA ligase
MPRRSSFGSYFNSLLGLEGVIGKKADSPYRAGRTTNWVKVKTSHGRHIDEERAKWNEG